MQSGPQYCTLQNLSVGIGIHELTGHVTAIEIMTRVQYVFGPPLHTEASQAVRITILHTAKLACIGYV